MQPTTKQPKPEKSKTTGTHVKDLRPDKDAKAGGQKKEDPNTNSNPLNPGSN
jgi:hypothetical protein